MNTLIKFNNFVKEINLENGRNYKLSVLKKYKDDEDICFYLYYIFNPYITTGISDKKLSKKIDDRYVDNIMFNDWSVKYMLNYIKENNTGTDKVVKYVQTYKNYLPSDESLVKLFYSLVTKNLSLGIDTKSINKVIPSLIPTFNVQLANKYFDKPELVEGKEFTLTTKLDGNRIIAMKRNGKVKFYTRAGKEYCGLVDLETELMNKPIDNIVFDGELIADRLAGQTSNDQFAATQRIAHTKDTNKHGVRMRVFDIMTADEFINQHCPHKYSERRAQLDKLFDPSSNYNFEFFVKVPVLYSGRDTTVIRDIFEDVTDNGEEGIMININDALYAFDRCNTLLKVKKMQTVDLLCIGINEGEDSLKGTLGSVTVAYKGNTVNVQAFKKEARIRYWLHPEEIVNKIIEVQYFEETKNKQGELSLRFPVFRCVRDDKDTPDF